MAKKVIPRTDQEVLPDNLTTAISALGTPTQSTDQASKLGKVEDTAHTTGDVGIMMLAVRNDAADCTAHDGDYVALTVNHDGAVYTEPSTTRAEDAAASSGDKGQFVLAVRNDANDCTAADGDYVALTVNHDGNLYTHTSATHAEDAAHVSGAKGVMSLAVRNDALATLGGADGDYAPLQVDAFGALYTQNVFGSFGNIFVNDQDAITCGVADRVFVAIYMLTNTVFTLLIAETEQLYLDDTGASTSVDGDGGTAVGSTVFPAGMTLYGRYDGFTLASGSVVAYVG